MKAKLLVLFLCCLCFLPTKAQNIELCVNENVELMAILSKLAGFREYSMDMAGQYTNDINSHFQEQKNHPAVLYMRELRQKHGISYDAVMSMAVHLEKHEGKLQMISEEVSTLEKRWEGVAKEKFLALLNQFYNDSRFYSFFESHQAIYQRGIQSYQENVLKYLDIDWYARFYGKAPKEKFSVIIGFCNGGGNYGINRHVKGKKKEVFAVAGYYVNEEGTPMYSKDYLPTIIHEFNHSFVNYLLDSSLFPNHVDKLENAGTRLFQSSRWAMQNQAYGNWQTVINESIVRAAVICYMLDNEYEKEAVKEELNEQIQRNFRWMPELVSLFRKYERKQQKYQSIEEFYPHIISFFTTYADKEDKEINSIK